MCGILAVLDSVGIASCFLISVTVRVLVTFWPEDTVKFVNISTVDDVIHERDEQLTAVLEAGSAGVRLGEYTATATIVDNDGNIELFYTTECFGLAKTGPTRLVVPPLLLFADF